MSRLWYHKRTRPLVIAHRGASAVAPESTSAALREAVRAGADMIEVDVQLTRDRRPVFFHDARLERTTNGRGFLRRTPYADLARLDAGSWFGRRFAGERVLLASKGLAIVPPRVGVNLELKRTSSPHSLIRTILALLRRTSRARRILLSSFDAHLLRLSQPARRPLALLCRRQPDRSLRHAIRLGCVAWHPFHTLVTERRVAAAHAAGLRVHVWTVDDARAARRFLRMGVDGLFTNNPARLVRILKQTR